LERIWGSAASERRISRLLRSRGRRFESQEIRQKNI
jgi:hypothetical protein